MIKFKQMEENSVVQIKEAAAAKKETAAPIVTQSTGKMNENPQKAT